MATVDEVASAALAAISSEAPRNIAWGWVRDRYAELVARVRFRHRRRAGSVVVPAVVTAGTVTIAAGDRVVTGDADAQAAWTPALRGRWFRCRSAWYEITGVDPGPALRLATPFAEDDASGVSYQVVQRYAALDPSVRFMSSFVLARLWKPLREASLRELDTIIAPGRQYSAGLGGGIGVVADLGWSPDSDRRLVEVWPYSTRDELIHFVYWTAPERLTGSDPLPPTIDPYVLQAGVLVDVNRWEAGQAAKRGALDAAAYFRNESRAQETIWERRIQDAARQDRGLDDTQFLLRATGGVGWGGQIRTARDEIYARGQRP